MVPPHRFYAVVIPGLEEIAAGELERLSAHEIKRDNGGVHFSGTVETMFRVNLRSRTITRVLLRLKRFTAMTLNELRYQLEKVDWQPYLAQGATFEVHASCHASKLMHTGKIENKIAEVLQGQGFSMVEKGGVQQIFIRIENNRAVLSIDTSGERLDRRGYRLESGKAPLRETLAAAVLQWAGWKPEEPLMVPMCGSGTFAVEAALMATKRSPGLTHNFPFAVWPQLKVKAWKRAKEKSENMIDVAPESLSICASDINPSAIAITKRNAERAGVEEFIDLKQRDIRRFEMPDDSSPGLLLFNPPYGERINADVRALYVTIGEIHKRFAGWRTVLISPSEPYERALGVPVKKRLKVKHGGRWVQLLEL